MNVLNVEKGLLPKERLTAILELTPERNLMDAPFVEKSLIDRIMLVNT